MIKFDWWKPYHHCFGLTFLITLALAPRMVYGFDSIVVMWINFLPVVCMLWGLAKGHDLKRLGHIFYYSFMHYIIFHIHHFRLPDEWAVNTQFWPASTISFILVTYLTYSAMRDNARP